MGSPKQNKHLVLQSRYQSRKILFVDSQIQEMYLLWPLAEQMELRASQLAN